MSEEILGWTEQDDALFEYEALPDWHPALFVDAFRAGMESAGMGEAVAAAFVTPEALEDWGDFTDARAFFRSDLRISMTPLYAIEAPDVAYVRLVETDRHTNDDMGAVPAAAYVTLVWRPDIAVVPGSSWRIHCIGEAVEPGRLPRSAPGVDPRA